VAPELPVFWEKFNTEPKHLDRFSWPAHFDGLLVWKESGLRSGASAPGRLGFTYPWQLLGWEKCNVIGTLEAHRSR